MNSPLRRWILTVITIPLLLLVAPGLVLWKHFGSFAAARAFVRGDEVMILPAEVELGVCDEGGVQSTQIQVINLTGQSLTLTGIHTPCSCVVASSLPAKLEAHAIFPLQLTIHSPDQAGAFRRDATLYTDSQISPRLPIEISGHMRVAAAHPGTLVVRDRANSDEIDSRTQDSSPNREPDLALPPGDSGEVSKPSEKK